LALPATASAGSAVEPVPTPVATDDKVTIYTFQGRGWGHGVGMSQWGARGRALAGWSAKRILRHYYRNTQLRRGPSGAIRVLLATSRKRLELTSPVAWQVVDEGANPRRALLLRPDDRYVFIRKGNTIELRKAGKRVARFRGSVRIQARVASSHIKVIGPGLGEGGRRYRGAMRLHKGRRALDVVNQVNLEQYLYGVVPREVPSRWTRDAAAAVEAQAIAARTYALATRKDRGTYDVFPDTRSQVYGGVDAENRGTTTAVKRTRRTVITYRGKVITAFFFSTSGGRTENNENVFNGAPLGYLRSVPDRFDRVSPLHRWSDPPRFTAAQLGAKLGFSGPVTSLKVTRRGRSPRVLTAVAATANGRTTIEGTELRAKLGLNDTWFTPKRQRVSRQRAAQLT
jgi:stage II sporulation protein D